MLPFIAENGENLKNLKGRMKAAGLKNTGLLKDLNDTLGMLGTIPNGESQLSFIEKYVCVCVCVCGGGL